jgi:dUTP pyrophosphatase
MNLEIFTENDYLRTKYTELKKNYVSDSGFDLFMPEQFIVPANAISFKINLQIKCKLTKQATDFSLSLPYMLFPRSSISKTPLRLATSIGLIDKDYRGDIIMILDNISNEPFQIDKGCRLGQLVSFNGEPFGFSLLEEPHQYDSETKRGTNGIGSTGI